MVFNYLLLVFCCCCSHNSSSAFHSLARNHQPRNLLFILNSPSFQAMKRESSYFWLVEKLTLQAAATITGLMSLGRNADETTSGSPSGTQQPAKGDACQLTQTYREKQHVCVLCALVHLRATAWPASRAKGSYGSREGLPAGRVYIVNGSNQAFKTLP